MIRTRIYQALPAPGQKLYRDFCLWRFRRAIKTGRITIIEIDT